MIREYLGYDNFSLNSSTAPINLSESYVHDPVSPNSLFVDIEGIHEGPTRNFTRYMKEALKSSLRSWTHPYKKPLIMHHNEKDGDIIGRIDQVEYKTNNTLSGTHALLFKVNIPSKEGAEQVRDGRLLTTSIGVIAHDIRCSCCDHQIEDENGCPDHERGGVYNNEYCYWDIYEMEAKELSYVVVPSDIYAKNVKIYERKEAIKIAESLQKGMGGHKQMDESKVKELQESLDKLQAEHETLAVSLQEEKAAKAALEVTNSDLTIQLTEANEKIEKVKLELQEKATVLDSEIQLRESAETQIIELKEAAKEELAHSYKSLRKLTGKAELSEAAIMTRSTESLKDAISDLQLELKEGLKNDIPAAVPNPALTDEESSHPKNNSANNIDLAEGLANLFTSSASHFARK